ncbi:MAG: hypothetical protein K940chlam3_00478 [Chlamydiae bacterium]|nr:hypothetical protein [Chlamydiota bacterium]
MNSVNTTAFSALPHELQLRIFSYLPARDLLVVSLASRALKSISADDTLWKPLFERDIKYKEEVEGSWTKKYSHCKNDVFRIMRQTMIKVTLQYSGVFLEAAESQKHYEQLLHKSWCDLQRLLEFEIQKLFFDVIKEAVGDNLNEFEPLPNLNKFKVVEKFVHNAPKIPLFCLKYGNSGDIWILKRFGDPSYVLLVRQRTEFYSHRTCESLRSRYWIFSDKHVIDKDCWKTPSDHLAGETEHDGIFDINVEALKKIRKFFNGGNVTPSELLPL